MDVNYINEVSGFIKDFMSEHGYVQSGEPGCFKGEMKFYRVSYNDANQAFELSVSPVDSDGNPSSFTVISSWLFDENDHGARDTKCIADDFTESVAADSGIKIVRTAAGTSEVALPSRAAQGTDPGMEAFAQKFLALFPQYKDDYKDSVAKYGSFLYVDFFKKYGVEKLRELTENETKNKKQLAKYWNMLGDMHYNGESIVGDVICAVIIAGSFRGDSDAFAAAAENYLGDYPFLKTAGAAAVRNYKKDKKLRAALKS